MSEQINWNDPDAVEALLASTGDGDIDHEIATDTSIVHTGVGREAMTAAGVDADLSDYLEDMQDPAVDIDNI